MKPEIYFQPSIKHLKFLITVKLFLCMNQIFMAIQAFLFITGSSVNNRTVCHHCSPFIGNVKQISVTLLALSVLKRRISLLPVLFMVVVAPEDMNKEIFYSMHSLSIKKVKRIVRSR